MENSLENNTEININSEKGNEQTNTVLDKNIEEYKKTKDWFIIVHDNAINELVYDRNNFKAEIKNGLLNGNLKSDDKLVGHFKDKDGKWVIENTTIQKFAKDVKGLRMMYNPIWHHAMDGLKWGALTGIGLKILDTTILLGNTNPTLAMLFLAAIGLCFVPKIGTVGMIIAGFMLAKFSHINFFMMAISAALIGAILGCLPGMFLGGITGWIRRNSLTKAHDAIDEPSSILLKTIALPLLGAVAIIYSYIVYFNQWLMSILE